MMELSDEEPPINAPPGEGDGEGKPGWDTNSKMLLMVERISQTCLAKMIFRPPHLA